MHAGSVLLKAARSTPAVAVRQNYPNVVQLLLLHGADPTFEGEISTYGSNAAQAESNSFTRAFTRSRGPRDTCAEPSRKTKRERVQERTTPLKLALESNRPYIIRMVCEVCSAPRSPARSQP